MLNSSVYCPRIELEVLSLAPDSVQLNIVMDTNDLGESVGTFDSSLLFTNTVFLVWVNDLLT